jgi:hypothetical protein
MSVRVVSFVADMVFNEYQIWFLHEYRVCLPREFQAWVFQ